MDHLSTFLNILAGEIPRLVQPHRSKRQISIGGGENKGVMTSGSQNVKNGQHQSFTFLDNDSAASLFYRPSKPLPSKSHSSTGAGKAIDTSRGGNSFSNIIPAGIEGRDLDSVEDSTNTNPEHLSQHVPFIYPPPSSPNTLSPDHNMASANPGGAQYAQPTGSSLPYDAERGQSPYSDSHTHHEQQSPVESSGKRPGNSRTNSWDLLNGIKKLEQSYEQFDTRNASQSHLIYAEGDMPKNKVSKFYHFLLNVSIVTRWILFIVPALGIIWIPGILSITKFPNAKIWSVKLIWWSIWLTVAWAGWWAALAASRIVPAIIRATLGVVAVGSRRYIEWMQVLHRYIALFAWSLALWISWNPLIDNNQINPGEKSTKAVDLISKLLFGAFICTAVLLFEKFSIQWIAGKFHERSYAERIAEQKYAVKALVTLYRFSSNAQGHDDLVETERTLKGSFVNPKRMLKKIQKGVRIAATTTTTALGNVASEIAGSSVLQPNSPQAIVKTALESANKSRLLARRIFYSFAKPGAEYMLVEDIQKYFPTLEEANQVFALFDKDANGDASRDEVEMSLMEFHREQLSIENSMRDLDSAVGRLDNIFMSVYVVIAALIIAVALEAQLVTLITGAGTLILGLSWLIGGSLQEVLTSIIFLFIKHPFDVGDRVIVNKETFTVKEIRLLSTVFLDGNSCSVQAPNNQLNSLFIYNVRRSPQMSETFTFDVSYSTSFEDLEHLREKMLAFVTEERRDYHPAFDVSIKDFPEQSSMTLSVDIKYKSNGQLASLKAKRRNKWICALKQALADVKIFGPSGDPNPAPSVARYTQVPWDNVVYEDMKAAQEKEAQKNFPSASVPTANWDLRDKNDAILNQSGNVFGEGDELYMPTPQQELSPNQLHQRYLQGQATAGYSGMPTPSLGMPQPPTHQNQTQRGDIIEMTARR